MKQFWHRAMALGLTACLSLSLLAMPAQAAGINAAPVLTTEHVRYMQGCEDGTFQPNKTLTRAEAAQMIYRLLVNPDSGTGPCSYKDVPSGRWYYTAATALCRLGLFSDGKAFRPNQTITRAEFVVLMARLYPDATGSAAFPDVPASHWAAKQVGVAASQGWVTGYQDGTFRPGNGLSRAEACTILNRVTQRAGDWTQASLILDLGLYKDVDGSFWAAASVAEASVSHHPSRTGANEIWYPVDLSSLTFTPGFHEGQGGLYYVDRYGKLVTTQAFGAYWADQEGVLSLMTDSYQMQNVAYYSQIDDLYAWVGCESVSTFTGLRAKGYARNSTLRTFVTKQTRSPTNDPEKGFVGNPFQADATKKTRTTIYPAALAAYANSAVYCGSDNPCADFRKATLTDLQRELLAGNCVVAYMTMWWEAPFYQDYVIEGKTQRLVSNNHAVLVYGYDPQKGYLISDPYNYYNRGEVHQYWEPASIFEPIWNQRKVGMVIR